MEKYWVTQCGWIRLFATVAIRKTLRNFWEIFCYRIKREHYEKFIGVREFLGQLSPNCFDNPFSTDTRTPDKNLPLLGGFKNEDPVTNRRRIDFSLPYIMSHRTEIFTIPLSPVLRHQPLLCHPPLFVNSILLQKHKLKRKEVLTGLQ